MTMPHTPAAPVVERACPECGADVPWEAGVPHRLFCEPGHRAAFHRRWRQRGGTIAPLAMACRATRDGTRGDQDTGKRAAAHLNRLYTRYADEDRAAGRMAMVDYVRLRLRYGYEPI